MPLGKQALFIKTARLYYISAEVAISRRILSQDIPLQTVFEVHVSGFTLSLSIFVLLILIYQA